MLQKFIHFIAYRRHPWRHMQFDELAEIYTSMMMRSLGFSLMGIFVPIYLYMNGVSLSGVFLFFVFFFVLRIPISYAAAFAVGRVGPKHCIGISTLLLVVFLSMLLTYNLIAWPLLVLALFFTISNGLFFVAYDTDFSKIKHSQHGGKELGYLYIFERLGSALGPLVGGIVASIFMPEATILLAIIVLVGSIVPLMLTNEPVKLHQNIQFRGFNWRQYGRDYIAVTAFNVEHAISASLWPLFVAIVVFEGNIYAKVGGIVALGMIISVITARFFGHVIDNKKSGILLRYGAVINAIMHLIRPFTMHASTAVGLSAAGEPVALAIRMPVIKGFYDTADSAKGYRIVFFAVSQIISSAVKSIIFLLLYVVSLHVDEQSVFVAAFAIAALASVITLSQRFPALKRV